MVLTLDVAEEELDGWSVQGDALFRVGRKSLAFLGEGNWDAGDFGAKKNRHGLRPCR